MSARPYCQACAAKVPWCEIEEVNVCTWLARAAPTFEEISVVAEFAASPANAAAAAATNPAASAADPCDSLNMTAIRLGISAAAVLQAWAHHDTALKVGRCKLKPMLRFKAHSA